MSTADRTARDGVIAALVAYVTWGFLPAYFLLMAAVPSAEMLSHRIVWSLKTE